MRATAAACSGWRRKRNRRSRQRTRARLRPRRNAAFPDRVFLSPGTLPDTPPVILATPPVTVRPAAPGEPSPLGGLHLETEDLLLGALLYLLYRETHDTEFLLILAGVLIL